MEWLKVCLCFVIVGAAGVSSDDLEPACNLPPELTEEIYRYQNFVDQIIETVTNGSYKGKFYDDLCKFVDKYGPRQTGGPVLEVAIKDLSERLTAQNLKTTLEDVKVPLWQRGRETAYFTTSFRKKKLRVKALGGSGNGNVTGTLVVVKDLEELVKKKDEIPGKVVLFSSEFKNYSYNVVLRSEGPARASHHGAVGALVRSITPFSIGSIHVGQTDFDGVPPIPAAAVSLEDADLLTRLSQNEEVKINLIIKNKADSKTAISKNTIIDIPGSSDPLSYVTVSGHIDSWDVGQGAVDDGGGAFLAMHTLLLLKHLKISPPQRTLRAILWTGEEQGLYGAKAYAEAHADELKNWTMAFESDGGLFKPKGFVTNGNVEGVCILKHIISMFDKIGVSEVETTNGEVASDISIFHSHNVPLMEPLMEKNNYFWFHHTEGDSMRVMNSDIMDRHLALITGTSYILANMSIPFPRLDTQRHGILLW